MIARLRKLAAALPAPNPILVRELRQMARGSYISIGLIVYLFAQLLVTISCVLSADANLAVRGAGIGGRVALANLAVLSVAALCGMPFYAGFKTTMEKSRDNMDMQYVTTLKPSRLADGKILSAMAVTLVFASATAPFLMFAYLMRGGGAGAMFSSLLAIIALSLAASCLFVMTGASDSPKWRRIAFMLVYIAACRLPVAAFFAAQISAGNFFFSRYDAMGWIGWLAAAGVFATVCALIRCAAVANFAPPHANRQLPLKSFVAAAWLFWGVAAIAAGDIRDNVFFFVWKMSFALIGNFMLVSAVSMPGGCSRRVRAEISPRWRRLQFLFFTGAENGICFSLAMIMLTIFVAGLLPETLLIDRKSFVIIALFPATHLLCARLLWGCFLKKFLSNQFIRSIAFVMMPFSIILCVFLDVDGSNLCALQTLLFAIMAFAQMPRISIAINAFRPPAKKGAPL